MRTYDATGGSDILTKDLRVPVADPTIECVMAQFASGGALVEAAIAALGTLEDALSPGRTVATSAMSEIVQVAAIAGDNLLVRDILRPPTMTIFVIARQNDRAVHVKTIDIDRDATALMRSDGNGVLDRYLASDLSCRGNSAEQSALMAKVRSAASNLSIIKSRLDLQASFLSAVFKEPTTPTDVIPLRAGHADIRELALSVGRQLDRRGMPLAARNRQTIEILFAKAMTIGA